MPLDSCHYQSWIYFVWIDGGCPPYDFHITDLSLVLHDALKREILDMHLYERVL